MEAFLSNPALVKTSSFLASSSVSSNSSAALSSCPQYPTVRRRPRAILSERRPHARPIINKANTPSNQSVTNNGETTPTQSASTSSTSSTSVTTEESLTLEYIEGLRKLALANGALGRGVRATLRAFYRRANFMLPSRKMKVETMGRSSSIYVEIGPAYVLSMGKQGLERVTRYAVEQRAWPRLHDLLKWEELSTTDARRRGAPLRKLGAYGERYGRHVFLSYDALAAMILVAEELISDSKSLNLEFLNGDQQNNSKAMVNDALAAVLDVQIEAVIQLKRRPIAGIRTVAAQCPRGQAHSNHDRNPSLVLWVNDDGVTGGAMCPVCMESDSSSSSTNSSVLNSSNSAPRHMTWRVHYIQRNTAVLCTPHRRIQSPPHVTRAVQEWTDKRTVASSDKKTKKKLLPNSSSSSSSDIESLPSTKTNASLESSENGQSKNETANEKVVKIANMESKRKQAETPVGGFVMKDKNRIDKMGKLTSLAYVTASLKIASDANTAFNMNGVMDQESVDGMKLRTIGTKARLGCPMQILLWSERRSKGPISAKRIEDVSWYAKQSLSSSDSSYDEISSIFDDDNENDSDNDVFFDENIVQTDNDGLGTDTGNVIEGLESEEWVPTPVVSVSAMRVCGWRDVIGNNGQIISVPAGWEASAQAWILFDIDDISELQNNDIVQTIASKITLTIRRNIELSGRCLVLQTGPKGLHVWAELREVREDAKTWFKLDETRCWYMDVGRKLLKAAHKGGAKGGKIDPSSCCAGRFARRPGWRLLEDGSAFRSCVVTYVPSRVKGRTPRTD